MVALGFYWKRVRELDLCVAEAAAASFLLVAFALLVVSPPDFIDQIEADEVPLCTVGLSGGLVVSSHGSVSARRRFAPASVWSSCGTGRAWRT